LKPPTAAVTPVTFSDRTCFATTGLTWRQARAFCAEHGVPVVKAGRRSLVRVDDFLRALGGDQAAPTKPARRPWDEAEAVRAAAGVSS
jgi:hypothetical protein